MNYIRVKKIVVGEDNVEEYLAIANSKLYINVFRSESAEIDEAEIDIYPNHTTIMLKKNGRRVTTIYVKPQIEVIMDKKVDEIREFIKALMEDADRWVVECLQ